MAAGNVRFRSEYYNTTGPQIMWRIDILDTEPTNGQIYNFECTEPVLNFEGLTQDLKPGIYPTTLKFGMFVRDTPVNKGGKNYGPSSSIINDLLVSNEGRFRVKLYRDGIMEFCGIILPDQSQYEDNYEPYLLQISAADGMYRWKDREYAGTFGTVKSKTCVKYEFTSSVETTPLNTCLAGPNWTMFSHYSRRYAIDNVYSVYTKTTWSRLEVYAAEAPDTDWTYDAGANVWTKAMDYENESIESTVWKYIVTRDMVNKSHRQVDQILKAAIKTIGLNDEYGTAAIWDVTCDWYENDMSSVLYQLNPLSATRLAEAKIYDKDWDGAINEICKLFFLRVYYAQGRYHFEQISSRDQASFTRHYYTATTGPLKETVNLDFNTSSFSWAEGGTFKILPPLKSTEVSISVESGNLIDGEKWENANEGERYIGKISREDGDQRLLMTIKWLAKTKFTQAGTSSIPPEALQIACSNKHILILRVRLVDVNNGTNYYLTGDADVEWYTDDDTCTWETGVNEIEKNYKLYFPDSLTKYNEFVFTSEDLPGAGGASYDIYISCDFGFEWLHAWGNHYFGTDTPAKYTIEDTITGEAYFINDDGNRVGGSRERTYHVLNNAENSVIIKNEVMWADTGPPEQSIEIYTSQGKWVRSKEWSLYGTGTGKPLLQLCAEEIMSLRMKPKRLYQGQILTATLHADNRLQRGTTYYLPLRGDKNTDIDGLSGEFLEIAKTEPPSVDVVDVPFDDPGNPIVEGVGNNNVGGQDPDDTPLTFETNAAIAQGASLTQVAIINTLGLTVGAGTSVTLNSAAGDSELVTLSQQVDPADTVMYFFSHTFLFDFPDGTPILVDSVSPPPPTDLNIYLYNNTNFTGNNFEIPQLNWLYFKNMPSNTFHRKVKLSRNGIEMTMTRSTGLSGNRSDFYRIDIDAEMFVFNGANCIPFSDEWLKIDIDLKR